MEEAEEELTEVKDRAEISATETAKQAVDAVAAEAKKEIDEVTDKANDIREAAHKLADKAIKAAQVSFAAAKNATLWARKLPKAEADKAIKLAKTSQGIAIALQNQARYVKRVAKLAGTVATHTIADANKATKIAEQAKVTADTA